MRDDDQRETRDPELNAEQCDLVDNSRVWDHRCILILAFSLWLGACTQSPDVSRIQPEAPARTPAPILPDGEVILSSIRFLEERVKNDPDDLVAYNKLAGYYLQLNRETGDIEYIELASRAARASLSVLPADQNLGGLAALTQVEFASHEFASSRDHARKLTEYQPAKGYGHQMLGDALLELGDYEGAAEAFERMRQLGGSTITIETRLARLAMLHGETNEAARRYKIALNLALDSRSVSRETVAWCRWQLGETAFAVGDYKAAEQYYRDSLVTFPDYHRALYSLGHVRAALGDNAGAIEQIERAVRRLPDPGYVAALGDLYKLSGREKEAAIQFELVERIGQLSVLTDTLYNRQLALFRADHDLKVEAAFASAKKEYETRRDIYGADALAWTALKTGRIEEARSAIKQALRLGTRDSRLFYHAGMIERAAGDHASAADYLQRAVKLNPRFDPLQAPIAEKTLAE